MLVFDFMEEKFKFCDSIVAKRLESSPYIMLFNKKTGDTFGVRYKNTFNSIDSLFVPQDKFFFEGVLDLSDFPFKKAVNLGIIVAV